MYIRDEPSQWMTKWPEDKPSVNITQKDEENKEKNTGIMSTNRVYMTMPALADGYDDPDDMDDDVLDGDHDSDAELKISEKSPFW